MRSSGENRKESKTPSPWTSETSPGGRAHRGVDPQDSLHSSTGPWVYPHHFGIDVASSTTASARRSFSPAARSIAGGHLSLRGDSGRSHVTDRDRRSFRGEPGSVAL